MKLNLNLKSLLCRDLNPGLLAFRNMEYGIDIFSTKMVPIDKLALASAVLAFELIPPHELLFSLQSELVNVA